MTLDTIAGKMLAFQTDEPFGYEADLLISSISFAITAALWKVSHAYCEARLQGWKSLSADLRDRMCSELAVLPIRFGLVFFSFSAVTTAFTAPENWGAIDTKNSLIACSLMTGAYLFDLSIHRDDILSTIHHCMGPALLLWIRTSFSAFDSSDALICRPLMMFVFFGAGIGGTAASGAVFLLRVGKRYLPSETLYKYFAPCLAALTVSTVLSCYLNTWYLLHAYDGLYAHFGFAYVLPVTWEGFECYLQWRWLFRFYQFENKFWVAKKEPMESPSAEITTDPMKGINPLQSVRSSAFPSWTVPVLEVLTFGWAFMIAAVSVLLLSSIYKDYGSVLVA